jgi:hypothetical protein
MENKDRQKILIIIAVVVVGLLVGDTVIYGPLVASWGARQKKIAELQDAVREDKALLRQKPRIMDRWQHMQDNSLTNDQSQATSALLKAIDRWSQNSGVAVENIAPQVREDRDENSDTMITTIECRADASGSMNSLLSFLRAINSEKMGIKLDNVELNAKDNNGQQLTMGLTISALLDPSAASAAPATPTQPTAETQ